MSLTDVKEKVAVEITVRRVAIVSLLMSGLVGMASATLNDTISPVIIGLTLLFTPLLAVIVAAVPLIVTIAIISFILGILAMILGKLR